MSSHILRFNSELQKEFSRFLILNLDTFQKYLTKRKQL